MLKETPRNNGAASGGKKDSPRGTFVELRDPFPTLAEMGLDKKTSKLAQDIAKLTDEEIEKVKLGVTTATQVLRRVAI